MNLYSLDIHREYTTEYGVLAQRIYLRWHLSVAGAEVTNHLLIGPCRRHHSLVPQ